MRKKIIVRVTFLSIYFISCNKESVINYNKANIIGKWKIMNLITKHTYAGKQFQNEYLGEKLDSFYFGDHGTFTFLCRSINSVAKYSLLSNNKISFYRLIHSHPETYEIKLLTNAFLRLYKKSIEYDKQHMPYIDETEINLSR